jgi:hypothetical protein
MNDDIQMLLAGYILNDLQTNFWHRFRTAFPDLLVQATFDSNYLRLYAHSPENTNSESVVAILVSHESNYEEIIVAFGGGHVNTRYFSAHPTTDVIIEDALEVIREIITGELVGVTYQLGGGTLCYACELDKRVSEGDRVDSWNKK